MDLPSRDVYLFKNNGQYLALEMMVMGYPMRREKIHKMLVSYDLAEVKKFLGIEALEEGFIEFYPDVGSDMK